MSSYIVNSDLMILTYSLDLNLLMELNSYGI